jgi:hypothetical protein
MCSRANGASFYFQTDYAREERDINEGDKVQSDNENDH